MPFIVLDVQTGRGGGCQADDGRWGSRTGLRNYLSYWAVEDCIYFGLRRTLKRFRKELGLPPIRAAEGKPSVRSLHAPAAGMALFLTSYGSTVYG